MPRRRRLTFKPKKTNKLTGGDPSAPTEAEWSDMTEYGSFVVRDEDGVEHTFRKGDAATVLPYGAIVGEDLALHKYWVAKIREIRARSSSDVWIHVQWYWSGPEVAATLKSFNGSSCGDYERVFSDHFDYVGSSAFDAVVTVNKFIEDDIDQPYIGFDEFYMRYVFEYKMRTIQPKPGERSCVCHEPYNPDSSTLMHLCPRPSCRRAYHQNCLITAKYRDPESITTRPRRLLSSSPDSDKTIALEDLPMPGPPRKKRRGRATQETPESPVKSLLDALPPELVLVAQQPIVRGAGFPSGGVAGNVRAVTRARRMVYNAFAGTPVPDSWEDEIDTSHAIVKLEGRKVLPALICPECKGAI